MALYIRTLYVVETRDEADAFNDAHDYASEIYAPEYAIPYGAAPHGLRYENVVFRYQGVRNSAYEKHLAENKREDITRGFYD